jgi:PAS domain-containing protein
MDAPQTPEGRGRVGTRSPYPPNSSIPILRPTTAAPPSAAPSSSSTLPASRPAEASSERVNLFVPFPRVFVAPASVAAIESALDAIEATAVPLVRLLEASAALYIADASASLSATWYAVDVAIAGAALIALYLGLLRPPAVRVQREQLGARLLLRQIPESVRKLLPGVRLFLEAGGPRGEETEALLYPAGVFVESFMFRVRAAATDEELLDVFADCEDDARVMLICDDDGVILRCNRGAQHIIGYLPSQLVGTDVLALLVPTTQARDTSTSTASAAVGSQLQTFAVARSPPRTPVQGEGRGIGANGNHNPAFGTFAYTLWASYGVQFGEERAAARHSPLVVSGGAAEAPVLGRNLSGHNVLVRHKDGDTLRAVMHVREAFRPADNTTYYLVALTPAAIE